MLKKMRDNLKSFHWVLWAVVIAFGISIFFWDTGVQWTGGMAGNWVATVNGEAIEPENFQKAFRSQVEFIKGNFRDQWKPSLIEDIGVGDQVLEGLIQRKVALQEAKRLGLDATPDEVMQQVRRYDVFEAEDGSFVGVLKYREILRGGGVEVEDFETDLANDIAFTKFEDLVRASVVVSDEEVDRLLRETRDTVSIEYAVLDPKTMEVAEEAPEEALLAFYEEHLDDYMLDEERSVAFVHLGQAQALPSVADEEEMKRYYEDNLARFTFPEGTRRGRQILLRVPPDDWEVAREEKQALGEELVEQITQGADFADLAVLYSDDLTTARLGGDLGHFMQGELLPSINDAFFEMTEGEVRGPMETAMGFHVIQLTEAGREEHAHPFEEARDEIASILYFSRMQEWIDELAARLREEADEGANLEDLASRHGLELEKTTVAAGEGIRELGASREIATAISEGAPGEVKGPLAAMEADQAFLEVLEVSDPEPAPFADVRESLLMAWQAERAREAAREAAEDLAAVVRDGGSLEETAPAYGTEAVESNPFNRTGVVGTLGRQPLLVARAFSLLEGEVGPVTEAQGGFIVFRVVKREELDLEEIASERAGFRPYLERQKFQMVWGQILSRLTGEANVQVNRPYVMAVQRDYIRRTTPAPEEGEEAPTS